DEDRAVLTEDRVAPDIQCPRVRRRELREGSWKLLRASRLNNDERHPDQLCRGFRVLHVVERIVGIQENRDAREPGKKLGQKLKRFGLEFWQQRRAPGHIRTRMVQTLDET